MKRFIIPVFAVLVIGGAGFAQGCGASTDGGLTEAEQRNNDGVEANKSGRPEAAVALFTEAIELDPALVEAYVNRAVALVELGRFDESLDDATKAIELEPSDVNVLAQAYVNRALTLVELGRFDESLDDATKAIELEPSDVNLLALAYGNRAVALRELGRLDEAEADRARACELGSMNACESGP